MNGSALRSEKIRSEHLPFLAESVEIKYSSNGL